MRKVRNTPPRSSLSRLRAARLRCPQNTL
jgi:hypothetical protein